MSPIRKLTFWYSRYVCEYTITGEEKRNMNERTAWQKNALYYWRRGAETSPKIWCPTGCIGVRISSHVSWFSVWCMSHNPKMEIKKMAMRSTSSIICLNLSMNKYTTQRIGLNFHEVFVLLHWLTQDTLCYLHSLS